MAEKETKFTDEELQSLNELSQGYQQIQAAFGTTKVQHILAEQQLNSLDEAEVQLEADYSELQTKERTLVQSLNDKYGPGQLDPQTGVFTPTPTVEEEPTEV